MIFYFLFFVSVPEHEQDLPAAYFCPSSYHLSHEVPHLW